MKLFLKLIIIFCFLQAHAQDNNLVLRYTQPAQQWEETLPLGNGKIGMMPDGGIKTETLVLNDITLWSGSPQDANNYQAHQYLPEIRSLLKEGKNDLAQDLINQHFICVGPGSGGPQWGCFQTLGNLHMDFYIQNEPIEDYSRSLDLQRAMAQMSYVQQGVRYNREYYTSFGDDVGVIRLTASEKGKISLRIRLDRSEKAVSRIEGNELQLHGQLDNGVDGKGMQFLSRVKAQQKGGTVVWEDHAIRIESANEVTIFFATDTDYKGNNYVKSTAKTLEQAVAKSYSKQVASHVKNFQFKFKRLSFQIGQQKSFPDTKQRLIDYAGNPDQDPGMAALFYQFGRYLSISSTRVGLLPPNLQGLWANQIHTPWNGDYHLDVNVQMNHWHLGKANLSELNLPLVELVKGLRGNGEKTAKAYYDSEGWVAHVITNIWGFTEPGESASWGITNAGSGWLCNNLWEHYLYTSDQDYLKEIYPVLKGAAQFYNSSLMEHPTKGWLVTGPSVSPENSFRLPNGNGVNVAMGPTIDNQIVQELFKNVIEANETLGLDDPFAEILRKVIPKLAPIAQVGTDGRILEWLEEYEEVDPQHRHISHLYGLYPAHQISVFNTPELAEASKKTLEVRGDDGPSWAIAYKMIFWAKLQDGERAYKLFKKLLSPRSETHINYGAGGGTYPNLFTAGPPFQIDGNFGGAAAIGEMLLQENDDILNILPALPAAWQSEGSISGLKAQGGHILDLQWKNGQVNSLKIYSNTKKEIEVRVNGQVKTVKTKKKKKV